MKAIVAAGALALCAAGAAQAQGTFPDQGERAPVRPLFASDDMLEITLATEFKLINRQKERENEERPALLVVHRGEAADSFEVDVRARGNFRKRTCSFPPLRLDFQTSAVEGTIFEGQDKVKLVGHCETRRADYEQYVLHEYLIYKVFNLFDELSLKARLVKFNYVDTGDNDQTVTKYGFLLEPIADVAARNGWDVVEAPVIPPDAVEPNMGALVDVFMYFVGNTDYDPFFAEPDEEFCCHNIQPIGRSYGPVFPVPFDFDFSGVIDTRYATPDPSLEIRSVRERLYRGVCRPIELLQPVFARFNTLRPDIEALYQNQGGLDARGLRDTMRYIEDFYKTINDPRLAEREFVRTCRRS